MKMINRTRMTSMNGVTLMSWFSAKSSSSSRPLSASDVPISYPALSLRRTRGGADMGAVQIARQQAAGRAGRAVDQFQVVAHHAREMVVDDDRGNRRDQAERGGQQR